MTGINGPRELVTDTTKPAGWISDVGLTVKELHALVERLVPSARDLEVDLERRFLEFNYQDQDFDLLKVSLYLREAALEIFVTLDMEDDEWISLLEAANEWNWNRSLHPSGFTVLALERSGAIYLRSVISTGRGLSEAAFQGWVRSFLDSINDWEVLVYATLADMNEIANDEI